MAVPIHLHQARFRSAGRAKARVYTEPSPSKGVNVIENRFDLGPQECEYLKNWWSEGGHLEARPGYAEFADTGTGLMARSLITHEVGLTTAMFAASGGELWDVTAGGSGVSAISGMGSDDWSFASISNNTVACNADLGDYVKRYDGTAWQNANFTSDDIDPRTLTGVFEHKERLFFFRPNDANFYHGTLGGVQGALTKFPLENLGNLSGSLTAGGSWTVDSGKGNQDLAVFIFSSGDIIVYEGSDPTDAEAWALVGRFRTAQPVGGHRATLNYGPDLVVMTRDGFMTIRQILNEGPAAQIRAMSRSIMPLVRSVSASTKGQVGWDSIFSPDGAMIIFSAPAPAALNTDYIQFVFNPETKAWFMWEDLSAVAWGTFDGKLYFVKADGKVYLFDEGAITDDGAAIDVEAHMRWSGMGNQNINKRVNSVQPLIVCDGTLTMDVTTLADLDEGGEALALNTQTLVLDAPGAAWDDSDWDVEYWAGSSRHFDWFACNGNGHRIQTRIRFSLNGTRVRWYGVSWNVTSLSGQK